MIWISGIISLNKVSINKGSADTAENVRSCIKGISHPPRHKILMDFITYSIQGGEDYGEENPSADSVVRVYVPHGSEKQSAEDGICKKMKGLVNIIYVRN